MHISGCLVFRSTAAARSGVAYATSESLSLVLCQIGGGTNCDGFLLGSGMSLVLTTRSEEQSAPIRLLFPACTCFPALSSF